MMKFIRPCLARVAVVVLPPLLLRPCLAVQEKAYSQETLSSPAPLKITLTTYPDDQYSEKQFAVRVTFENISKKDLRLLRRFAPQAVFFWFKIQNPDGTYIHTPLVGNADFRPQDHQYLTLKPDETFGIKVDLLQILPDPFKPNVPLAPGDYTISVQYTNQYGTNCFRGTVDSQEKAHIHLPRALKLPSH